MFDFERFKPSTPEQKSTMTCISSFEVRQLGKCTLIIHLKLTENLKKKPVS